jgi:hypothetical protein
MAVFSDIFVVLTFAAPLFLTGHYPYIIPVQPKGGLYGGESNLAQSRLLPDRQR